MSEFLSVYGDCTGPLGFPMRDAEATALDRFLDTLPEVDYRRRVVAKATPGSEPGERADVSWITTEAVDRQREVVLSSGMDDTAFRANPIVTMAHDYTRAPIARSEWRRRMRDGLTRGVRAKTVYPPRPEDWSQSEDWLPDRAFALVRAGLLCGKSIGFLAVEASPPTEREIKENPEWAQAARIVRRWMLLEYACHWLPVNPECCVQSVSKGLELSGDLKALGLEPPPPSRIPFTTEADMEQAIFRRLAFLNPAEVAAQAVRQAEERLRGRV